jgi:conjugal transfer pilus assembly protein TraB
VLALALVANSFLVYRAVRYQRVILIPPHSRGEHQGLCGGTEGRGMVMRLSKRFNELSPSAKKQVIWSLLALMVLLFVFTGYNRSGNQQDSTSGQGQEVRLDPDLIDKTIIREQRRKLDELEAMVTAIQRERARDAKDRDAGSQVSVERAQVVPEIPPIEEIEREVESFPPPAFPGSVQPRERKTVGRIIVLSNEVVAIQEKDERRTVYLPPSFMEAHLLTGFDAATSGSGRNSPEPLLLRIQTPAVLPNDVKAELSGCFVVAEAVGRLDKERADVRLVSLSCLSNEGRGVIDAPIKGFVTDADSKVGLAGRVVSRMGAATIRAIAAGLFEGAGDVFKTAATTTSTSALGTTSTIDASQVGKSALGTGLSQGAQTMSDFYLDLVKQTTPIIEVGAARKITVIIAEGRELEIKELPQPRGEVRR